MDYGVTESVLIALTAVAFASVIVLGLIVNPLLKYAKEI